jgi:hypothetical protein
MRLGRSLAVGVFSVLTSPCLATAAVITVEFTGEVLGHGSFLPPPASAGSLAPGDPVHGTFRYDTGALDTYYWDSHQSQSTSPLNFLEVTLGAVHVGPDTANRIDPSTWLQILDDFPYAPLGGAPIDRFGVFTRAVLASSSTPIETLHLQFFLTDQTHSVFDSEAIPTTLPDISAFDPPPPLAPNTQGQLTTETGAPIQVFVNFTVTEWHVVPEPVGGVLSSAAALLLLAGRRLLH